MTIEGWPIGWKSILRVTTQNQRIKSKGKAFKVDVKQVSERCSTVKKKDT